MSDAATESTNCPDCGLPLLDGRCSICGSSTLQRFVRREFVLLVVLSGLAVGGFFGTRTVASAAARLRLDDAAAWYRIGVSRVNAGEVASGIEALRRATAMDRDNASYRLMLSTALGDVGRDDEARRILLGLRDRGPQNPEVNLRLARLEARRGDIPSSIGYYEHALYGAWAPDQADRRRQLRQEFVEFLLHTTQRGRALAELLLLQEHLPDDLVSHTRAGRWFLAAGDARRALTHYQLALRFERANDNALAGAGEAAFAMGDYRLARRYLQQVSGDQADVKELRSIVDLVVALDPLAPRLRLAERRARAQAVLERARTRLDECARKHAVPDVAQINDDLRALDSVLGGRRGVASPDIAEAAVELVGRIEQRAQESCGPDVPLGRALQIIGRRDQIDRQ